MWDRLKTNQLLRTFVGRRGCRSARGETASKEAILEVEGAREHKNAPASCIVVCIAASAQDEQFNNTGKLIPGHPGPVHLPTATTLTYMIVHARKTAILLTWPHLIERWC
jgi:hypothetical protein